MGCKLAKLTAVQARSLGPRLHADGGSFYCTSTMSGDPGSCLEAPWEAHRRSPGSVTVRSLELARERAAKPHDALADGRLPNEVPDRLTQDGAPIPIVAEAADGMIQDRGAG